MTEWLIVLAVILVIILLTALRYRRQLQTGLQLWRMFRQFKQAGKPKKSEKEIEERQADKNAQLVRCAKCNKWVSPSEAVNLRSKTFYCSTNCMERAARIESLIDR